MKERLSRVIASTARKGGVGKTTVGTSVAYGLARGGSKVLLVDVDSQGQSGILFGLVQEPGIFNLLVLDMPLNQVMRHTGRFDLWLLPGNALTGRADVTQARFEAALAPALDHFDYIVFDTAASGQLREHVIGMADTILTIAGLDSLDVDGVRQAMEEVERSNPGAQCIVVPNELDRRLGVHEYNLGVLREAFAGRVLSPIPSHVRVRELASAQMPIWEYDPRSPVIGVLEELLEWIEQPEEEVLFGADAFPVEGQVVYG